jgi:hypothetical protein
VNLQESKLIRPMICEAAFKTALHTLPYTKLYLYSCNPQKIYRPVQRQDVTVNGFSAAPNSQSTLLAVGADDGQKASHRHMARSQH